MNIEKKVALRNFAIALLTVFLVVCSVEITLTLKNRKPEHYQSVCEENPKIQLLQAERTHDEGIFFTTAATVGMSRKMYGSIDTDTQLQSVYPLLGLNSRLENEDVFNIVVIGDSFVQGDYSLNRNEIFWRVLENDFRKENKNVNVYGVGMSGASAYEELAWLTDYALVEDLDPDLVIFGYVYNDPDDIVIGTRKTVDWNKELPFLLPLKKLFPNVYNGLIESIVAKTMYSDKYTGGEFVNHISAPPILKGRFYEKYKTDFVEKLEAFAATADFSVAVVTLPTIPDNYMLEQLYAPLEELYAQCEYVDYYNSVEAYSDFASREHSKNYQVNIGDFHPGSATNRFYADYIKSIVDKQFADVITDLPANYDEINDITINEYLPYRVSPVKLYEDEKEVRYEITYPATEQTYYLEGIELPAYYLVNPLRKQHIKLSFSHDINITEIQTQGQYDDIELYYTRINEKLRYDDHTLFDLERSAGDIFVTDPGVDLTSVLISADFTGESDRTITLTMKKAEEAAE
ncbi:MAG: SGNH/GDSL hydrolase family protein [Ruminococcaceae bacterium]|nr:SGNH/GDSL hydrolase family protein [Oscillospiraceae bacterium]